MNGTKYIHAARRTQADLGSAASDFMHAAAGLVTEVEELRQASDNDDAINATEELGDLCWFASLALRSTGLGWPHIPLYWVSPPVTLHVELLRLGSVALLDMAKGRFVYGKAVDAREVERVVVDILMHAEALSRRTGGGSLSEAMAANVAKLQERYPEKFDQARALGRDTGREADAMESVR